jgi:hypothetical protein
MRAWYVMALCCAAVSGVSAQDRPRPYEGAWIWDRAAYVAPENMPEMHHMVAETMLVYHDDGQRYAAHIEQVFDEGQRRTMQEDFAEDGKPDSTGTGLDGTSVAVSVVAGGSRQMISRSPEGETHEMRCQVSDDAMTLSCTGHHVMPDGRNGEVVCIYHRDLYVIPVS